LTVLTREEALTEAKKDAGAMREYLERGVLIDMDATKEEGRVFVQGRLL